MNSFWIDCLAFLVKELSKLFASHSNLFTPSFKERRFQMDPRSSLDEGRLVSVARLFLSIS